MQHMAGITARWLEYPHVQYIFKGSIFQPAMLDYRSVVVWVIVVDLVIEANHVWLLDCFGSGGELEIDY